MCDLCGDLNRSRKRSRARRLAVLLVAPLLPALITGWFHPLRPDWAMHTSAVTRVSVVEVVGNTDVLWVDAREPTEYLTGHVSGAINLSETNWNEKLPELIELWQPEMVLVVYCDGGDCLASQQVAARLIRELGLEQVKVLEGGLPAWQAWANLHHHGEEDTP